MKVALVNLPWRTFTKTGVRAGSRWPHLKGPTEKDYLPFPFFLAYAAALLKKNNFDIKLIDAIAEEKSYKHFLNDIQKFKPHLLVCETSTVSLNHDLGVLEKVGRDIPIAICGPDINIQQPSFLEKYKFIAYVFIGEYEFILLDLVRHLKERKNLNDVLGLIYRDLDTVKINPPRPLINLDELPWPLRQGLPMESYNDTPGDMPIPSVQMSASRGCPYKCKFCLWPQVMYQGNHYRTRNVIDVVDEMEYLVKQMNFKSIYFDDDTFNCSRERMIALCNEIKKRKLNVPWAIMARADLMTEEILEKMREAGLFAVKYGVESGAQELLDNINKNMDLKKTEYIINFTKRLGIKTHLTFAFGLPGENKETIRKTMALVLKLDPTTIQFSIATPFPGTTFYKEMKKNGWIVCEDWAEYDGNHKSVIASDDITKKDLEQAIRYAYKQWAIHCAKRNPFKKNGYRRLIKSSFKKYGLFITLFKVIRFLIRFMLAFLKEKVSFKKEIKKRIKENGLKNGRLSLFFDEGRLGLYWEGMKLTKGAGFVSLFNFQEGNLGRWPHNLWDFKKISETEFLLTRKQDGLGLDELWRIKVIDEKQIDWDIEINFKNEIKLLVGKIMLVLSGRYRKWIDSWGEDRLYPANNHRKVELKNPDTDFIGLRGRKKLKGQLPTVLLDLSKNNGDWLPVIKNAGSILGARVLEAQIRNSKGDSKYPLGLYKLFSGRIKIVEEDFNKCKPNKNK